MSAVKSLLHEAQAVAATSRTSQRTTDAGMAGPPPPKRSAIVRAFASVSHTVSDRPRPSSLPVSQVPDWNPGSCVIGRHDVLA